MIQITKVEIRYFRSIYRETIHDLKDVCVFSGRNDCGKSNVIRALNLFFNNQTGWREPLDFDRDFCRKRLVECRATVKAKQFIEVKVTFRRGNRYDKSLPQDFWVSRKWYRDSTSPDEQDSLREDNIPTKKLDRAKASLQRYLNTIRFEYVPAVKDRSFFSYSLGILQDAILQGQQNDEVKGAVTGLNDTVRNEAKSLHEEFAFVSGVDIQIELPSNIADLFRAFSVSTGGAEAFPLVVRGDGIQARFLPSLIHHVAQRSNKVFIWGFEEPENCLEHALATKLAEEMVDTYSKQSQILLTSHSPAFITLDRPNVATFRAATLANGTALKLLSEATPELTQDLGLVELQRRYQASVLAELETIRKAKETVDKRLKDSAAPVLLVEGKTDVVILTTAWRRLFPGENMPFRIVSANTENEDSGVSNAGAGILRKAIESCRLDHPPTLGLLDQDEEGIKQFALNKNFVHRAGDHTVKIAANGHVGCMLLPGSSAKTAYLGARNLQTEFLFPESCITTQIAGKGLKLSQKTLTVRIESLEVDKRESTDPQHRKIESGKVYFAETIVPTFLDADFAEFRVLFVKVREIFSTLK